MTNTKMLLFPILLVCAEMAAYLSNDMYLAALPDLMREFQVGANQIQLTLSFWFLGSMSMQLVVGPLSDCIGRRPVLICGMFLFVISTLLCALALQLETLIWARFIQGSTICFIIVAGYASIHELFNQRNAISLLAFMNSIIILAPAFGPLIGGIILIGASWRWTFWPLFIMGLIILVFLIKWMPEPLPPEKRQPLKLATLINQYQALIKNRRFVLLLLSYSFVFCGIIAWLATGPFLVNEHFHQQPYLFGCLQLLIFGFYILSSYLVKHFLEKIGVNSLIRRGLVCVLLGSILATVLSFFLKTNFTGLLFGMLFFSFGFGLCSAPLQRLAIEASSEPMGSRMALVSTSLGLFGLLATLIVKLSYNGNPISLAAILLVTALLAGFTYSLEIIAQHLQEKPQNLIATT